MSTRATARTARLSCIAMVGILAGCRGGNGAHAEPRPIETARDHGDRERARDAREHADCASNGAASAQGEGADGAMHWSGNGRAIEVRARDGAVRASPADGSAIEITATRRRSGRRFEPARLRVVPRGDVLLACIVPVSRDDEDGDSDAEACAGDDGDVGAFDIDVRVPKGARFAGWTANGAVEATHLDGDVEAHAQNGSIVIGTSGVARASTVNGSIAAKIGAARWDGTLTLETVNGRVEVELPRGAGARLSAETVHGKIGVGMKLAEARVEDTRVEGLVGNGGGKLRLRSVNGAIDVR